MNTNEYQKQALRTVYPDLSYEERLTLGALGLSGEAGETVDTLKKFLFHRNGKPLDIEKIRDESGDVLWYLNLLFATLGLTWEEVMEANIAKLEARHVNGFTPRYKSDSGASE